MLPLALLVALIFLGVVAVFWLAAFLYINDFSVPVTEVKAVRRALVIFPHADDETNVAGFLWRLCRQGVDVTFVVLTRGESGTPDAHEDVRLKQIRAGEVQAVAQRLGAGKLIQEDFGDGKLATKQPELRRYLTKLIDTEQPDMVITYDQAGLYGHEDHMICTHIVTELLQKQPRIQLWYSVWPKRLWQAANLPTHMAKDSQFMKKRGQPNARIFIDRGVITKIASVYSHHSQRRGFRSMMPMHLPIWFVYSLQLYEYYERVS